MEMEYCNRRWYKVTDELEAILEDLFDESYTKAKVLTESDGTKFKTIKVESVLEAAALRRASVLAPESFDVSPFDIFGYKFYRIVIMLQDGKARDCFIEICPAGQKGKV